MPMHILRDTKRMFNLKISVLDMRKQNLHETETAVCEPMRHVRSDLRDRIIICKNYVPKGGYSSVLWGGRVLWCLLTQAARAQAGVAAR